MSPKRGGRRARRHTYGAAIAALGVIALGGCNRSRPAWDDHDRRDIYGAALRAIRDRLSVDTLFVDPRTRFLLDSTASVRVGDFNAYPDKDLSTAIHSLAPEVVTCVLADDSGCRQTEYPHLLSVSEIRVIGKRDAGVLASYVATGKKRVDSRGLLVRLRYFGGTWRVAKISDR